MCWFEGFLDYYHNEHLHSGIEFVSPIHRRTGKDLEKLQRRQKRRNWLRRETLTAGPGMFEKGIHLPRFISILTKNSKIKKKMLHS
jgi:hypothetical protein